MKQVSDNCTGCGLCAHKCLQKAITIEKNPLGEEIAFIVEDKCINCNSCFRVCPSLAPVERNSSIKCYAAWAKNQAVYDSTTSGGIASLLAEKFISDGGVVYGAAFTSDYSVKHIRVCKADDIEKLKGSKYVQSSIYESFQEIKKDLSENKRVLFVGTPCQVAAVKRFAGENENLYLIDLICHGTPPQEYFRQYLKRFNLSEDGNPEIRFRTKRYWLNIKEDNRVIYNKRYDEDPFFCGFMNNLLLRENCFNCLYADEARCGDITLGDFRGLKKEEKNKYPEFVSCVLINSKKGESLFNEISGLCNYNEHSIEEAVSGNNNLKTSSVRPQEKDQFDENYIKHGFDAALKKSSINFEIRKTKIKNFILIPYRIAKYGIHYKDLM